MEVSLEEGGRTFPLQRVPGLEQEEETRVQVESGESCLQTLWTPQMGPVKCTWWNEVVENGPAQDLWSP